MNPKDLDLVKLSKLTSQHVDHVTCLQCCKYYMAPMTGTCGHSLCNACWRGRRTCPVCSSSLDRKSLKLNLPLQTLTQHVQALSESFEKLFNIKLDEFSLDTPDVTESENDPNKHVKDWLTSSENHFSAPVTHSQQSCTEQQANPLEISASNIIIHTDVKKIQSPEIVKHIPVPQDDWDKIEEMVEPVVDKRNKENVVGPMDIEPFFLDDAEYTLDNPRRSSRKRELKHDDSNPKKSNITANKHTSDSSGDVERKSDKNKQNWNSVKKMRKEFSKLNKKNRTKLNVSIEMVKKTQKVKPSNTTPVITQEILHIDDNTPDVANRDNNISINTHNNQELPNDIKKVVENSQDDLLTEQSAKTNVISEKPISSKDNVKQHSNNLQEMGNIKNSEQQDKHSEIDSNINQIRKSNETIESKVPFMKKSAFVSGCNEISKNINSYVTNAVSDSPCTDDIEITIKVGNTITNILIKKKESDVQVKVNTDCGVQTSLGEHGLSSKELQNNNDNTSNVQINLNNNAIKTSSVNIQTDPNIVKSASTKKNTASADTVTAQFEITESVEKELSKIMECEETPVESHSKEKTLSVKPIQSHATQSKEIHVTQRKKTFGTQSKENILDDNEMDDINDLDIFASGSIKEPHVHLIKTPSDILVSTVRSKFRTQKIAGKRDRDDNDDDVTLPKNKKKKIIQEQTLDDPKEPDSEPINYDVVMNQVFANIDADIEVIRSQRDLNTLKPREIEVENVEGQSKSLITETQINKNSAIGDTSNLNDFINQKHSENVFSIVEKEEEHTQMIQKTQKIPEQIEELLTPDLCRNMNSTQESQEDLNITNKSRRKSQHDDSESVVEETPQKDVSFPKLKRASTSNRELNQTQENLIETKKISFKSVMGINVTESLSETNRSSKDATVVDTAGKKQTLDTPLTIRKFADQIKHKSTPVARKSLNFKTESTEDDPERTICPTAIAKTTQEKEFLSQAFESTPTSVPQPLTTKNILENTIKKLCLAASCLSSNEITRVKYLCQERNWNYLDKYTKDVTHLVVGVDEENKSQRSVKYMSALAGSKWIVSFDWVKQCIIHKDYVSEEPFEAIDTTGDPGPRRSRMAKEKLFKGFTFFCLPPFSVLDLETLREMLLAAGGKIVYELHEIRVLPHTKEPALLLAEPENTQEDRFIYLTMEVGLVPVNYEWVLNCLGSYTLGSIHDQLLCPSSLLPPAIATWPQVLLAQED